MPWKDISLFKGLNSYVDSPNFLKADKGTSGHARAALYHNQLIDKLQLKSKYDYLKSGQIRVMLY